MGTRFLATPEANAHPVYKAALVAASEEDTVRTILFGHGWHHAPHRTLSTAFVKRWVDLEGETQDSRPDEPAIGRTLIAGAEIPIQRCASIPLNRYVTDEQRGRRPIFNATLRAAFSWLFFRPAAAGLARPVWIQIWALRYRQSGSDRLEKQPTDLRQNTCYFGDRTLNFNSGQSVRLNNRRTVNCSDQTQECDQAKRH